ncbi:hypothetical protein GCM10029963_43500 [Micromonospora andamanensis]
MEGVTTEAGQPVLLLFQLRPELERGSEGRRAVSDDEGGQQGGEGAAAGPGVVGQPAGRQQGGRTPGETVQQPPGQVRDPAGPEDHPHHRADDAEHDDDGQPFEGGTLQGPLDRFDKRRRQHAEPDQQRRPRPG